ncbi:hypothetical protein ACFVMC_17200 [Nocardia sp. NPDC127579]|uniref:hypothetical protein n=1 Tax=Nocardia sp. NPDC127579 TaxID=3345402 RepID=UPI003638945B
MEFDMNIRRIAGASAVALASWGVGTGLMAPSAVAAAPTAAADTSCAQPAESVSYAAEFAAASAMVGLSAAPIAGPSGPPALQTAPWQLKCAKAVTGYALYQAQGMLVCLPPGAAHPLAGAVCNLAKLAGGHAIDFNKLCDD